MMSEEKGSNRFLIISSCLLHCHCCNHCPVVDQRGDPAPFQRTALRRHRKNFLLAKLIAFTGCKCSSCFCCCQCFGVQQNGAGLATVAPRWNAEVKHVAVEDELLNAYNTAVAAAAAAATQKIIA